MTKSYRTGQVEKVPLSTEQESAIDLLITGKNDREAAEACGVTRQTVNGWKKEPAFLAELNRRRAGLWEEDIDRLRALVGEAVTVLEESLQGHDEKARREAAVHILRAVGIYGNRWEPTGPTSEREIQLSSWLIS